MPGEDDDILGQGIDDEGEGDLLGSGSSIDAGDGTGDAPDTGDVDGLEGLSPKVKALLVKKGIKNLDDLVDDYEKQESARTKLKEDVDRLSISDMPMLSPEQAFPEQRPPDPLNGIEIPDDPGEIIMDKAKGRKFFENALTRMSQNITRNVELQGRTQKARAMYKETMEFIKKDPKKFQRLRPTMVEIARQRPDEYGIKELYNMAEKVVDDQVETQAAAVRAKALEGIPVERLRAIVAKSRPAHIAGSGGSSSGDDTNLSDRQKIEKNITDSILRANIIDA